MVHSPCELTLRHNRSRTRVAIVRRAKELRCRRLFRWPFRRPFKTALQIRATAGDSERIGVMYDKSQVAVDRFSADRSTTQVGGAVRNGTAWALR
jgi:hypothetical protein